MELSEEQNIAFNKYLNRENILITGPGGSGKTELIKKIQKHAKLNIMDVQVCALTGCAAVLLQCKARTVHSWSGIGLANGSIESIVEKIKKSYFKKKVWLETDILIIDEVSMMSQKIFELLDLIGKTIRKNKLPFGGIQVIFSGDFYQLPPVGTKDEPETINFCFESPLWSETFPLENHICFTQIFRQNENIYATILNQIREGIVKSATIELLENYVDRKIEEQLIIKPTKLFPLRSKVERINLEEMKKLNTEKKKYSIEYVYDLQMTEKEKKQRLMFSENDIDLELKYIQSNLLCENIIKLKVGCQVMCIVNFELPNGNMIYNGSQGIITSFNEEGLPNVKFTSGNELIMNQHLWKSENIPGIGVKQIPLILSWALTIHKIQGQSLDYGEIDIGSTVFECGQTYVALSRIKTLNGLYLQSFDPNKIKVNEKVRCFYDNIILNK
jgi:ATP-dependent DNA helicase PIF1